MHLCDALHVRVIEQQRGVVRLLHVKLEEGLRAEGRIHGDGDLLASCINRGDPAAQGIGDARSAGPVGGPWISARRPGSHF